MKKLNLFLAAASLALASSGANAALVTVSGATVNFSFDDDFLSPLFGSYSVAGDTLKFSPTTFSVEKDSKGLAKISATTPLITVSAKSGYALNGLELFEQGDYLRIEDANKSTKVSVLGQFIVNDTPASIQPADLLNVAISADDYFEDDNLNSQTTIWNAVNHVSLSSADFATVKIENILVAGVKTDTGLNLAFIEKKLMNLSAETISFAAPVPVPGAIWLFGSALAGIVVSRRSSLAAR